MDTLQLIAVFSLALLAVAVIILVSSLVGALAQAVRLLALLEDILLSCREQLLPRLFTLASTVDGVKDLGDNFGKKFEALKQALAAGLKSFSSSSKD